MLFFSLEINGVLNQKKDKNPKAYLLMKLPDMYTRVQTVLQDKQASDGKIDFTDVKDFLYGMGPYLMQCNDINFNNINLNNNRNIKKTFGIA